MAGTAAVALTGCSNNDAQVKQNEDSIASVQKQVKTLQENLDAAKAALEESLGKINSYLEIEKVTTSGDALASIRKEISALETKSSKAVTDAVAALETKLTTLETSTKAALDAATGELIKDAEDKVVPIQTQINEINEDIAGLGDTYATDAELQAAIDAVNAAMGDLVKEDDKVVPLQDQIKKINTNIGNLGTALESVNTALTNLGNADIELQGQITAAVKALDDYKAEVAETYAKLADLTKLEGDLTTLINNTKTALETTINNTKTALETTINTNKTNAEQAIAEANATITTAKNDLTTLITNTKTTLEASIATKAVQADVTKAFEDAAKDLADFEDEVEETYATKAALEEVTKILESDYVSKEVYVEAIAALNAAIGKVKTNDEGVISLQKQIDNLEAAKATIKALEDLEAQFAEDNEAIAKSIANLQAQVGEVKKDEDGKTIISLQTQIDDLAAKIGEITATDKDGKLMSLQAQIDELRIQIGDLSASELKDLKAQLTFDLQMAYANFKDTITDKEKELREVYGVDTTDLFTKISRDFDHEMQGYLAKGNTYILLASTKEEAIAAEEEYAIKIGNYINPALFEISKQLNLERIKSANLKYIGDISDTNSIRYTYAKEVEDTAWFTDADIQEFEPEEYKAATEAKDAAMTLSADKAIAINAFLEQYNTAKNTITAEFTLPDPVNPNTFYYKDEDAANKFIALLDTIKGTLKQYDDCTNAKIENLDPFTGNKGKEKDITDLDDQLENDTLLIKFVLAEAADYLKVNQYVDTTYKYIQSNYKNLNFLKDDELSTIKTKLIDVIGIDNYAALKITVEETTRPRTSDDLKAQFDGDIAKLDLINEQASGYNSSVGEARQAVTYINYEDADPTKTTKLVYVSNFNIGTEQEPVYAIKDLEDKIYAVPKLATYLAAPVEKTDNETKTILDLVADDKLAIGTLVDQGKDFNTTLAYVVEKVDAINDDSNYLSIKAKDTANQTKELTDIVDKLTAVPVYTNYVENEKYKANMSADQAKIDLVIAEANAYNTILKLVEDKITAVKALAYIGKPATPADGTSEEEKIIVEFNKIAKYANYINESTVTVGEGNEAQEVYIYTQSKETDTQAINLLFDQVETYNNIKKLAANSVATVTALTNITDTEKTDIVTLINGVAKYANYVGNNTIVGEGDEAKYSYLLVEEEDTAKIKLIVAQAKAYDEVRGYAKARNIVDNKIEFYIDTEQNIINAKFIKEDEQTAINALINGVPAYANYINDKLTTDKIAEKVAADKLAVDNYVTAVGGYNGILGYINADTTGKKAVVDGILANTQQEASEKSTITTAMTGIPVYKNYFGTVKVEETTRQLTAEEIQAQALKDKAAVDLLVTRAQVFKDIYDAVNAPDAKDGLVAYIDGLSSGYTADLSKGQFTTELKNKFKAQFTDLAVAAKFDEVVKDFTTDADFTAYKNSIIGAAATDTTPAIVGKLPLIKKSATVFCDILKYVNTNEDYINDTITFSQFTGDYEIYAQAFINNFIALQDYDAYMTAIKDFTTEDAFDTYYGTNIKTFIDNVVKVAKYENKLLDNVNFVKEAISNAQDPQAVPTIKTNAATYLTNVVKSIYAEYTAVTKADNKYTTKTTIEDNANAEPKSQLDAVDAAIQKLYEADIAAANLSTNLTNYINEQRDSFFTNYYMYKDDAIYRGTNELNQFGGYNQAALEAWNAYIGEIQEYRLEKEYKYTIPTESTYTTFTSFIEKVAVPTSIASRFDAFKLWYSEDTAENPKGGKVYEIIAKYEELDAKKVPAAKEYFLGEFKKLYDGYYATISDANSKTTLTASYDQYRSMIGSDYGSTTTTIIMFYLNGVTALDNTYNSAVTIYRSAKLSALESKYNNEKADISQYTIEAYTKAYNNGIDAIKADTVLTEAQVDTAYNAAVAAMNTQKELDAYKTTKRTALETSYNTNVTNYSSSEAAFTTAKNTGVDAINEATSTTAVDTAYNTAISAMNTTISEYKTSYKTTLGTAYATYGQNPAENITTAYNNGLTAIEGAATESAVETACTDAIAAMLAEYKTSYKTTLGTAYGTYGQNPAENITTAYNNGLTAIDGATTKKEVEDAYDAAVDAMLVAYKNDKLSDLSHEYSDVYDELTTDADRLVLNDIYENGQKAINNASDKNGVDQAYNDCASEMLGLVQ